MIKDLIKSLFGSQAEPEVRPTTTISPPLQESATIPEIKNPPRASENPNLPTVAKPLVLDIERKIARILETLGQIELGDMTAKEMTDLRDVHLPALISSYVDIPADHRARIFKEKGKSASYVLKDSLEVISQKLDEEIARLAEREISSFHDVNRFISDRYGIKNDPFA